MKNILIKMVIVLAGVLTSTHIQASCIAAPQDVSICSNVESVIINVVQGATGCQAPITVINVTDATYGFAQNNNDGTVTYYPNGSYASTDGFNYVLQDNLGNIATGPVNITFLPVPQVIIQEGNVCLNSVFSAQLPDSSGGTPPYTYNWVTGSAANGTVIAFDSVSGNYEFQPDTNFVGTSSFSYNVTDSNGCQSEDTQVLIFVGPIAFDQNLTGSSPFTNNLNNFVAGGMPPYTYIVSNVDDGTFKFKLDRRSYTFTLNAGATGGSFDFMATDNAGCTDSATVTYTLS